MAFSSGYKTATPRYRPTPDYSKQLGLFADTPDTLPGWLEPSAPEPARVVEVALTPEPEMAPKPAEVDRGPPVSVIVEPEPDLPLPPSRDFRITDAHHIGQGNLHHKARDNLAAIRTLKTIETQNRDATEDEKAILAKYAGWGALAAAFESSYRRSDEWDETGEQLEKLLTDEEYSAARGSTPNAHFTSPIVIQAMWRAMEQFGLQPGATVLEPAMGAGHFFGLAPEHLPTKRTGVELDSITARIAQKLYPDSTIFQKGFEDTRLPDGYFDAVIGNIPFGNYGVYDPAYKPQLTKAIHDYFFAKSLDKVRVGGVMALITSRYTMDKQDASVRKYLGERADLVGAIRLPNTAFKANAGTEVTTDIIFLQKRTPGTRAAGESWESIEPVTQGFAPIEVNEYFARHPEMMLGQMRHGTSQYGRDEPTLEGELTPERLHAAVSNLPTDIFTKKLRSQGKNNSFNLTANLDGNLDLDMHWIKDGAYAMRDGKLVIREGDSIGPAKVSDAAASRIRGMIAVRDAVRLVFKAQLEDASEERIVEARQLLNGLYDSFLHRHGPLSSRDNVRAYSGDPDQPLLLSLEEYDAETKRAKKAAIFSRRTLERYRPVERVETAAEALTVSLNEAGGIDWERMEQLTGRTPRQMQRELGSLVYRNPEGGKWETADEYLSGNVRTKLTAAETAAELDPTYGRNIEALKVVQPADLEPGDIEARLGSSWIPASDVKDFICELLDIAPYSVRVNHSGAIATWTVDIDSSARHDVSNTTTHGTARAKASDLIDDALNGRSPTIYDQIDKDTRVINQQETLVAREKQQQLKDAFREWVWKDQERSTRLAREYNDRFNNIRLREFDGSHLTFPGMNRSVLRTGDLDKHQKDAVWRTMQSGSTLLAHCVGAGKSFEMAAAAMELRRIGLATKPMIVVPNHLVDQWGAEFIRLYPNAKLMVAGKDHFSTGNRQKAMARIATGNYDAVIVSHGSFEKLPVSDETFQRFTYQEVNQLEEAIIEAKTLSGDNRRIVKELEKAKKRLITKLKQRADRENKDNTLTFEELGIDQVFVDESDFFKNLGLVSKMNRIAGLPNTESNRAFDMFMKTRYVREINNGRGVVFATGTPISNTMAEMYTLLRYLAPELLKERGVEHFDAWAANFGEAVTSLELAPDGSGYRMHTRFAKFVNLPELLSMFRTVADVQTADMLKLPRPALSGGKPQIVAAPASDDLKEYVKGLVKRSEELRTKRIDPSVDNMLKITGDGRKAALDMRLVYRAPRIGADTKLSRAVDRIYRTWDETKGKRLTQLVFCDLSTPNPDKFNVYDEVKQKLADRGIPECEIKFIHDADTDIAKKTLFDNVNSGRVRILIGSTEKMGAGTNVQKKLKALHHLDAPWRPRDIEQREGRILRQGNENEEVDIHRYVTEGSFDAYMWQTLETKARFIQQVMNGSVTVRQAEDLEGGALTYAEIKAIASGNPAVMEKVRVDTEVRKLDQLRAGHINQQHQIRRELSNIPQQITRAQVDLGKYQADMATRDKSAEDDFSMTVGKRVYEGKDARAQAAKALTEVVMSWRTDPTMQSRASYRGFEILSRGIGTTKAGMFEDELPDVFIRGAGLYKAKLNAENPIGTIQSIEHAIRSLDNSAADEEMRIAKLEKTFRDYQEQAGKPFEHEGKLKEMVGRQKELNAALDLDKNAQQVAEAAKVDDEDPMTQGFVARLAREDSAMHR